MRLYRILISAGALAGIGVSWPLWLPERDFPLAPLVGVVPGIAWAALIALISSLVGLAIACSRIWVLGIVGSSTVLLLADTCRLQPWFVMYLVLVLPLLATRDASPSLLPAQLYLPAMYFWSGFSKLNLNFFSSVAPWILGVGLDNHPRMKIGLGLGIALFEIALGTALIFGKTRQWAVKCAIVMHLFLLLRLGPLGLNWNTVVWPWNLALVFLVPLVFRSTSFRLSGDWRVIAACILSLSLAPLVNRLYSGQESLVVLYLPRAAFTSLPREVRNLGGGNGGLHINLGTWSMRSLRVPLIHFQQNHKAIAKTFCHLSHSSSELLLKVEYTPLWSRERHVRQYSSEEICR
jgi:hypothetical protein